MATIPTRLPAALTSVKVNGLWKDGPLSSRPHRRLRSRSRLLELSLQTWIGSPQASDYVPCPSNIFKTPPDGPIRWWACGDRPDIVRFVGEADHLDRSS